MTPNPSESPRAPSSPEVERIFAQSDLFRAVPPIGAATFVQLERRRALFGQGSVADSVFLLGAGRARMLKTAPDRSITLAYFGPGDLLGEDALFYDHHRAEVRVVDALEAVRIPAEAFLRRLRRDPELAVRVLALASERKRTIEHRLESLLTKTVEARVADFLLGAAAQYGVVDDRGTLIGVKFTHLEIASFVGSTRETVTLVLGEFKRRGLLLTEHRRLILRDMEALRRLTV